jgi:hypothetical protein
MGDKQNGGGEREGERERERERENKMDGELLMLL